MSNNHCGLWWWDLFFFFFVETNQKKSWLLVEGVVKVYLETKLMANGIEYDQSCWVCTVYLCHFCQKSCCADF